MYIQKQLSRKVEGISYSKYVIVIPPETIKKLRWDGGQEVDFEIKNEKLILTKKK